LVDVGPLLNANTEEKEKEVVMMVKVTADGVQTVAQ
jgi:hypothetical protein